MRSDPSQPVTFTGPDADEFLREIADGPTAEQAARLRESVARATAALGAGHPQVRRLTA